MQQRAETDFFSGEPLRALSILVYSDNVDLQRSASLTFAEITERGWYTMHLSTRASLTYST
jgi:vacuolar protein 8